jgi:ribosomal protein L39E
MFSGFKGPKKRNFVPKWVMLRTSHLTNIENLDDDI